MLEQAVAVGLVVDLGRRRVAEAGPVSRALAEEAVEQLAQLRVLDGGEQLAQVALEALDRDRRPRRRGRQPRTPRELASRRLAQLDLRAPAFADLEAAGDEDRRAGAASA